MKCPKCKKQIRGTGKTYVEEYRRMTLSIHIKNCGWKCRNICDNCNLFSNHKECTSKDCKCKHL